jgi:hypothetical protein
VEQVISRLKKRFQYREHTLTELKTQTPFKDKVDKLKEQYREQYERGIERISQVVNKTKKMIAAYTKEQV